MKKNNLIITIISIILTFFLAEILSLYCLGTIPTILTTFYLIILFTIIEYILLLILYILKKKKLKQKIPTNELIGRILLLISLIIIIIFIIIINIDYLNWYMYSAPFYLNVLIRIIEFIVPDIILILISFKLQKKKNKRKKNNNLNKILLLILIITIFISIILIIFNDKEELDTIKYKDNTYVLLEYNMGIFTYNLNKNTYYEEDIIYKVPHKKWDIVYLNGDLFIRDKQVKEATNYYQDDKNYEWYFILDKDETEKEFPISITNKELKYIYDMDNMKRNESLTFDSIENMGTIKKVSKDGFIFAIICLANYNDSWYYRTEIINEIDEEYIIILPNTLNKKIKNILNNK